jgi:hypothetical protein
MTRIRLSLGKLPVARCGRRDPHRYHRYNGGHDWCVGNIDVIVGKEGAE